MDFTAPRPDKGGFDPYVILGLARDATPEDIRRAYRRLAKEYHPDVNPDGEDRFKKITEAYELLLDPDRRAEYDRTHEDGVVVLNAVHVAVKKFVVLPSEHAAVAVTLWIAATHALPVFEHATRLAIHSAVKRSGKSRLLEIVNALAYDTIATTNTSVPALFRIIDQRGRRPPTLILDEADRLFGSVRKDEDARDLIALLNNGFRPGNPTWRCVGPQQVPTPFSNYAMAVIAGIGRKPDTIEDRAVNITMRRRLPGEKVEKFRLRRDPPALHELRDRLTPWLRQHHEALAEPVGGIPAELEDWAADTWEPLLAVADAAGGEWPAAARRAAVALTAEAVEADGEQSEEIRLLADVWGVFKVSTVNFMATHDLLSALRKIEDAPWSSEFTPEKLAKKLRTFGIRPKPNTQGNKRGYSRSDFKDAWSRYVPGYVSDPSDPSETGDEQGQRSDGLKPSDGLACRSTSNPSDPSDTRQDKTEGQTPNLTGLTGLTGPPPENGSAARSDPGDGSDPPNAATDRNDDVCVDCGGQARTFHDDAAVCVDCWDRRTSAHV